MSHGRHRAGEVAIGVDAGGTWLRLIVLRSSRTPRRLVVPSRGGDVSRLLGTTWRRQGWSRDLVTALVVASRGVWTVGERRALTRRLRHLARRVRVLADAEAALLGALGDEAGLLILAGTGSIVVGRSPGGRWQRAGGLGPLLGDEGSAFWIGREWLRATAAGPDALGVRRLARSPDAVARVAGLAPRVLGRARSGDRRARRIVAAAQAHLAALAVEVARRLRLREPVSVSWAGRLAGDARFRQGLRRALARAGLGVRWRVPRRAPVDAAARLALGLAGERTADERDDRGPRR